MAIRDWYKDILPSSNGERPSTIPAPYQPGAYYPPPADMMSMQRPGQVVPHNGIQPTPNTSALAVAQAAYGPEQGSAGQPGQAGQGTPWEGMSGDTNLYRAGPSGFQALPPSIKPVRGPRVRFFDPMSMVYATGYRDRRYTVSYDTLRRVSYQLSLVGAVILTRVNQVSNFAQPYRENRQVGFQIRYKDEHHIPSEEEKRHIVEVEKMISMCGFGTNPFSPYPRDDFETFLKKFTRDTMTHDQACFEVIPDEHGRPYEFRAVDATTIRLAATYDGYRGSQTRNFQGREFSERWRKQYGDEFLFDGQGIYTVQVIHGRIENIFTANDLAFCIRNPRTDIWANGYGYSEIEICLNTVLRMLWAEEFNARNFQNGSMAHGVMNLKGDQYDPRQMEAFRRQWRAHVSGVENSWRIPMMQIPEGVEFVNLRQGNREMEYQAWLNYLLKILTGVYQIDPSEINFDLGSGSSGGTPLFESKHEWKIKHSKDKGLRPLLKFIAKQVTKYVIDPLDDRLYIDFVGLDHLSENERHTMNQQLVTTSRTVNEIRAADGLEPRPGGDVILNPIYFQSLQTEQINRAETEEAMAAWRTAGDAPALEYGTAPPIPLYLQASFDAEEEEKKAAMMSGQGGPPPGAPGAPPPGGPPGGGGAPPGGDPSGGMPPMG